MGLTQTLATSLSGLTATQTNLALVAGNVANAQTPGYVTQRAVQSALVAGGIGDGVQVSSINRVLDAFVQQQLRTESAGGAYADMRANFFQQLQAIYGQPGSDSTLDSVFNNFTGAVQALSTSPGSTAAQSQTIAAAQSLAQTLNNATQTVQTLRTQADQGIAADVQQANNAMQQIAAINQQLASNPSSDSTSAALEDQRDQYIDQLSKLMDIRIIHGGANQITVFTTSGQQLVGLQASQLTFAPTGSINANQLWNADPTKSGLGSVMLVPPSGTPVDLTAQGAIRSGEIAAYLSMRDGVLVQAQGQLDQIAAQMSSALSDTTTDGNPATSGTKNGFDVNIANVSNGNTIHISYTDASSVQHTITVVRVDDPSALPLPNTATSDPNDTVVGIDFSGGAGSVATQLNAALGATGLQFSNPIGTTLEILDSGPGTITVNSASITTTATSLNAGSPALPFFVDGTTPFTGAYTGSQPESIGYAGRIAVNAALVADPTQLVAYAPATPAGDPTRPDFIYNQLVNTSLQYSPASGIGGTAAPFQGTLSAYIGQVLSTQSLAANAATKLQAGQAVVVNSLQTRFNQTSAVNIDTEMANLLTLQNAYGANARVMSTVKQMLDALLQM